MKITRIVMLVVLASLILVGITGCGGSKSSQDKPISEVKAEAEKLSAEKLRAKAEAYHEAIMSKKDEVDKLMAKVKDIPLKDALSDEAKELKSEVDALNKSVKALTERFNIYYDKLKEVGGNVEGLSL